MKAKSTIFILLVLLLSCKKSQNTNVVLNGLLTNCAANSSCTHNYYDNADFINGGQLERGAYRVFCYKSVNANLCGITNQLYFETSMNNDDFVISSNQIAAGQVAAYDMVCPCCDVAFITKPIGGEIKGKRTDETHWLINASIVFGTAINAPLDTLVVNQYFASEKLP